MKRNDKMVMKSARAYMTQMGMSIEQAVEEACWLRGGPAHTNKAAICETLRREAGS